MIRAISLVLVVIIGTAACSDAGSSQETQPATSEAVAGPDETTATTATTPTPPAPLSAAGLGELFLQALNSGDADAVAALAPAVPTEDLQDVIGSGPYSGVDCLMFNGQDVCSITHEAAAYEFVLDLGAGLVTSISYVGGA